jgi:hypothetical protein
MEKVYTEEKLSNRCEIGTEYYIVGKEHPYFIIYEEEEEDEWHGYHEWQKNGKTYRDDGPADIKQGGDGHQIWYQKGKFHRSDGPAVINMHGRQYWWKNGKQHRVDGPAAIWDNGEQEWYVRGKETTKEKIEFLRRK